MFGSLVVHKDLPIKDTPQRYAWQSQLQLRGWALRRINGMYRKVIRRICLKLNGTPRPALIFSVAVAGEGCGHGGVHVR